MRHGLVGRERLEGLLGGLLHIVGAACTVAASPVVKGQPREPLRAWRVMARLQCPTDEAMNAPAPDGGHVRIQASTDCVVAKRDHASFTRTDKVSADRKPQALLNRLNLL